MRVAVAVREAAGIREAGSREAGARGEVDWGTQWEGGGGLHHQPAGAPLRIEPRRRKARSQ